MKDITDLLGRLFLSAIFFFEAIDTSASRKLTFMLMTRHGFTWHQEFLYNTGIGILLLGAILILVGYRVGLAAILVLSFWLPVTLTVYSFWMATPEHRDFEAMMFVKNLAVAGGTLILAANGAGKYSVKRLMATTKV